jgi:hypothetical protein
MSAGLDILNTGMGHAEVNFSVEDPVELERGKRIIQDMLRRGYLLFIEGDDGKLIRVLDFQAATGKYIIGDGALYAGSEPLEEAAATASTAAPAVKRGRGRPPKATVPMTAVRATAMGRSAGG